jgi:hypothetical protein
LQYEKGRRNGEKERKKGNERRKGKKERKEEKQRKEIRKITKGKKTNFELNPFSPLLLKTQPSKQSRAGP